MIGLFDSGIGGLSVLRALEELTPNRGYLYYADTANFPYGNKTPTEIVRCASQSCAFLLSQGVSCIVIACHTASVFALSTLKQQFPVPILGISEDLLLLANSQKKIAILATQATIQSGLYQKALPEAIPIPCNGLAELVEVASPEIQPLLQRLLAPLLNQKVELVFLGCTHYSHIKRAIEEELDVDTCLIDPAYSLAERILPYLSSVTMNSHTIYVSGSSSSLETFLSKYPPRLDFTMVL